MNKPTIEDTLRGYMFNEHDVAVIAAFVRVKMAEFRDEVKKTTHTYNLVPGGSTSLAPVQIDYGTLSEKIDAAYSRITGGQE